MGPSLRDVDWIYGNDDAQLFSTIAEGRAHGMPSWQTRLTADQIWKLVTYIKSLRTRNELRAAAVRAAPFSPVIPIAIVPAQQGQNTHEGTRE